MKKSFLEILVQPGEEGLRLDRFLTPSFSTRSYAEKLIKQNRVKKKGGLKNFPVVKPSHKVKAGECYLISFPITKEDSFLEPFSFFIPILYEDEHLLVINKPAGIVTHPGPGHEKDTVVNALIKKTGLWQGAGPLRPGVVHRLDKNVSGLLVLSKTSKAGEFLKEQFQSKKIKRFYRALTLGKVTQKSDTLSSFIGRHPRDRKKFYSFKEEREGAKKAITHYQVLESFQDKIHHIQCRLETGRTHQIRVQLSGAGLPILGDELYFSRRRRAKALSAFSFKKNTFSFNRIALYSAFLEFTHPVGGKTCSFSLNWPEELHFFMEQVNFKKNFFEKDLSPDFITGD